MLIPPRRTHKRRRNHRTKRSKKLVHKSRKHRGGGWGFKVPNLGLKTLASNAAAKVVNLKEKYDKYSTDNKNENEKKNDIARLQRKQNSMRDDSIRTNSEYINGKRSQGESPMYSRNNRCLDKVYNEFAQSVKNRHQYEIPANEQTVSNYDECNESYKDQTKKKCSNVISDEKYTKKKNFEKLLTYCHEYDDSLEIIVDNYKKYTFFLSVMGILNINRDLRNKIIEEYRKPDTTYDSIKKKVDESEKSLREQKDKPQPIIWGNHPEIKKILEIQFGTNYTSSSETQNKNMINTLIFNFGFNINGKKVFKFPDNFSINTYDEKEAEERAQYRKKRNEESIPDLDLSNMDS